MDRQERAENLEATLERIQKLTEEMDFDALDKQAGRIAQNLEEIAADENDLEDLDKTTGRIAKNLHEIKMFLEENDLDDLLEKVEKLTGLKEGRQQKRKR